MTAVTKQALGGLGFLIAVLAAALFVPGTLDYWQAWVFLTVFASATAAVTIDLARRDPALLARRVKAGPSAETGRLQRLLQSLASVAFLGSFLICAVDHRAGWSRVPVAVVVLGDALVAGGLFVVFRVFRANTFTAATIVVERAQQVVSTGPYAVLRHPMYAGALVMMLGVPLALGSWWGLPPVAALAAAIVWRLLDEERQLAAELPGYPAYLAKVKHRLIPFVW